VTSIPEHMLAKRRRIAQEYLRGQGIEVGALDMPLWVPPGAHVRYVDRMSNADLLRHYPELADRKLVHVDIIDDGERLRTIPDASQDFVVANHMLEHCENPLGALRTFLRTLRPDGFVYLAVPDKRQSFDAGRPITPFDHLVADDCDDGAASREAHYLEWARKVVGLTGAAAVDNARANQAAAYSIHFHVWDSPAFLDFLSAARSYLRGSFELVHFELNDTEVISVLRRAAPASRGNS
jgi:SAM-dependent methyltransferase